MLKTYSNPMTPQPITPQQMAALVAQWKQQQEILGKRMEVTERCLAMLERTLEVYDPGKPGAEKLEPAGIIALTIAMVQLMQLKLNAEEGRHQLGLLDSQIKQAESPIALGRIVPGGGH